MKYIQIDIKTSRAGIEPLLAALMEVGITDTVVEDPADIDDLLNKKNEYDWDYVDESVLELRDRQPQVTVYMNDDEDGRAAAENLRHDPRRHYPQAESSPPHLRRYCGVWSLRRGRPSLGADRSCPHPEGARCSIITGKAVISRR